MNFLQKISLKNLWKTIKNTCSRFPISVIIILIISTIFFILLHSKSQNHIWWERLLKANISLIMAYVLSIWIYLAWENFNLSKLKQNLWQFLTIVFAIIFYYNFSSNTDDFKNFLNFFLNFSWIMAFLFFSFYIKNILEKKLPEAKIYYSYFYNLNVNLFISYIFAWILFTLWIIAIGATDALFNLHINSKNTYWNWSIISLALISPFFLLSQIPDKKEFLKYSFKENKFFSFLIKYVAIPFIYIYFAILYAYSIKVLANFWDWPKWIISWLVIWFSIFWYLTYSFSLTFEKYSKAIKFFRKIFPYVVIPQVIMLFYAIYLRIAQYDFTINRYFVVVFGIWLILVSFHFIFSKKKNLIALPVSLFIIIILISIIPKYNVYDFPIERQFERLKTDLQKAWILQNSKIVPLKSYNDIEQNLSKNIYSEINYLCNYNNCEKVKKLFPKIYSEIEKKDREQWKKDIQKQIEEILKNKDKKECKYKKYYRYIHNDCFNKKYLEELKKKKYKGPNIWEIKNWITKRIKVKNYFYNNKTNNYWSYSINYEQNFFPIDIKWYSKIYNINNFNDITKNYVNFNSDTNKLEVINKWKIKEKIDISNVIQKLITKFGKQDKKNINKNDLIFNIENWKYKILFKEIRVKNPNYKKKNNNSNFYWNSTRWYLLIK